MPSEDVDKVLAKVDGAPVVVVTPDELAVVKAAGEVVRAHDTSVSGPLEVLEVRGRVLVYEELEDGRMLLRKMVNRQVADALVDDRLESYDRMWDGCGIHIDYGVE